MAYEFEPTRDQIQALMLIYKDVDVAVRELGLSKYRIYELCDAGDIAYRLPGAGGNHSQGRKRRDSKGRRIGYKRKVRMADVWRLKYGEEWARCILAEWAARQALGSSN